MWNDATILSIHLTRYSRSQQFTDDEMRHQAIAQADRSPLVW